MSGGGETVWGDPAEVGSVVGGAGFDVVLDNNGKDLDTVRSFGSFFFLFHFQLLMNIIVIFVPWLETYRPVIDWAKSSGVKQFLFISSAGIYKPTEEPPHVEGVVNYLISM